MKKMLSITILIFLMSFTYADDSNNIDQNTVSTNISRNWVDSITSVLSDIVKGVWNLIAWIFDGLIKLIMSLGLNDFQAQLTVSMMLLAFSAWKAGSIASLVDKIRWIIIFFVALIIIGVFTGVIQ